MIIRQATRKLRGWNFPFRKSKSRLFQVLRCFLLFLLIDGIINGYRFRNYYYRLALIPDWPADSLDLRDYIWPMDDTDIIIPRGFCEEKTFLLIVIESSVNNFLRRQDIRETWGNTSSFNYPVFNKLHEHLRGSYYPPLKSRIQHYAEFLTGEDDVLRASVRVVFITGRSKDVQYSRPLQMEADRHNDIIQEGFIDSYNNLTLKSVMALKHLNNMCSKTTAYVFKADDDTFVNVPNVVHILLGGTVPVYKVSKKNPIGHQSRLTATSGLMVGRKRDGEKPIKDMNTKFYMPAYIFPNTTFPECLSGGGYLMSMDVVQRLYVAAIRTKIVHMEDVYVTGLCAQRARVIPAHNSLFRIFPSRNLCTYKDTITLQLPQGVSMHMVWDFVLNFRIKCPLNLKQIYKFEDYE
ncbi:beta-1,3-galactosyltransferase 1-like [Drosophila rhopaloa]|uniref:Hexosyltransferase n=1 Tax=Drosophila rhopaloa TaxID=1041015 RepID=A0ABM5GY28_DRORH|nr:beta-1,3-galactosyltransferase 1-like [Drosophila rhopaloa]